MLTKIKLEYIKDIDMLLFLENGITGGISQVLHSYCEANNKYIDSHDKAKPSNYILYPDANNLYGWALSQPLSYKNFKWISNENEMNTGKYGYILEVDLEYPYELNDQHSDYLLAPVHQNPPNCSQEKVLITLQDKRNNVVHYKALELYKCLGLKVTKINRVIQFEEKPFIKEYIDLNSSLRSQATNNFEKNFFKSMNNFVFKKTIKNIRNTQRIRMLTDYKKLEKLINKVDFKSRIIFGENLVAVH